MLDWSLHMTGAYFLCAAAVSCPHFVGLHLFRVGVRDYARGCEEMMDFKNAVKARLEFLVAFMPVCCLLRIFCAPALWHYMADLGDFSAALRSLPTLLWIFLWVAPFVLLNEIVQKPGIRNVLSSEQTIRDWPEECAVQRPYHGLLSTRCHAASGGFYVELLWNAWIVLHGDNLARRVGGISIPLAILNAGMLAGGPVNFLARGPKRDRWVADATLLVSFVVLLAFSLLDHAWFGLRSMLGSADGGEWPLPYTQWPVLVWLGLLVLQAVVCRSVLLRAEDLGAGPPWSAGGCEHKEFFLPRFWGLILVCYGMFVSFNLWVLGFYCLRP